MIDTLEADQRKIMYGHYTLIASILLFITDEKMRSKIINSTATEHEVSKRTIRNYLCLYLSYMDITVLAPRKRLDDAKLTKDEKHTMGFKQIFLHHEKQSLMTAYTMMLEEKYCDSLGVLAKTYPSFYQFCYLYRKTKTMQNFYISRDGLKNYQRNNRPFIDEGVQSLIPVVGVGMLDATICDIYLINDSGILIGRPILTACIDD